MLLINSGQTYRHIQDERNFTSSRGGRAVSSQPCRVVLRDGNKLGVEKLDKLFVEESLMIIKKKNEAQGRVRCQTVIQSLVIHLIPAAQRV